MTTTTTDPDILARAAQAFAKEFAEHELTVLHDDGLYRHLRFARAGTGVGRFDLVTWPGALAASGDLDGYVFTCAHDMIEFFRESGNDVGGINPGYWAEKTYGSRKRIRTYDQDVVDAKVTPVLAAAEKDYPGVTEAWAEATTGWIAPDYDLTTEAGARHALDNFEHIVLTGAPRSWRFDAEETYEWNLKDWSWHYLRVCHAIRFGVTAYTAHLAANGGGSDAE